MICLLFPDSITSHPIDVGVRPIWRWNHKLFQVFEVVILGIWRAIYHLSAAARSQPIRSFSEHIF